MMPDSETVSRNDASGGATASSLEDLSDWVRLPGNSFNGRGGGGSKKNRIPPKRGEPAYVWFCNCERSKVKERNSEYDINDVAKALGRMWVGMDAEAKKIYEDMAAEDKARYEREFAEYKSGNGKGSLNNDIGIGGPEVDGDEEGGSLGEVERPISDVDLLRIMECPVCSEFPIPPIFSCEKGHFTCSSCMKLLENCPLCESPFTGVRNFALESIIESSKFKCRHSHLGCPVIVTGGELAQHMTECMFRPLECPEPDCLKSSLTSNEYFEHMQQQHGLTGCYKQLADGKAGIILKQNEESDDHQFFIKLTSGKQEGPTFVIMTKRYRTFMCWWAACLEPQMLPKYAVAFTLENKIGVANSSVTWNLPLQPVWKSFDEIRDTGCCAVIPDTHLTPFYVDEKSWNLKVEVVQKTRPKGRWLANFQHYYPLLLLILVGVFAVLFSMVVEYGLIWCDSWRKSDPGCNDSTTHHKKDFGEREQQYIGYRGFYYKI